MAKNPDTFEMLIKRLEDYVRWWYSGRSLTSKFKATLSNYFYPPPQLQVDVCKKLIQELRRVSDMVYVSPVSLETLNTGTEELKLELNRYIKSYTKTCADDPLPKLLEDITFKLSNLRRLYQETSTNIYSDLKAEQRQDNAKHTAILADSELAAIVLNPDFSSEFDFKFKIYALENFPAYHDIDASIANIKKEHSLLSIKSLAHTDFPTLYALINGRFCSLIDAPEKAKLIADHWLSKKGKYCLFKTRLAQLLLSHEDKQKLPQKTKDEKGNMLVYEFLCNLAKSHIDAYLNLLNGTYFPELKRIDEKPGEVTIVGEVRLPMLLALLKIHAILPPEQYNGVAKIRGCKNIYERVYSTYTFKQLLGDEKFSNRQECVDFLKQQIARAADANLYIAITMLDAIDHDKEPLLDYKTKLELINKYSRDDTPINLPNYSQYNTCAQYFIDFVSPYFKKMLTEDEKWLEYFKTKLAQDPEVFQLFFQIIRSNLVGDLSGIVGPKDIETFCARLEVHPDTKFMGEMRSCLRDNQVSDKAFSNDSIINVSPFYLPVQSIMFFKDENKKQGRKAFFARHPSFPDNYKDINIPVLENPANIISSKAVAIVARNKSNEVLADIPGPEAAFSKLGPLSCSPAKS